MNLGKYIRFTEEILKCVWSVQYESGKNYDFEMWYWLRKNMDRHENDKESILEELDITERLFVK